MTSAELEVELEKLVDATCFSHVLNVLERVANKKAQYTADAQQDVKTALMYDGVASIIGLAAVKLEGTGL